MLLSPLLPLKVNHLDPTRKQDPSPNPAKRSPFRQVLERQLEPSSSAGQSNTFSAVGPTSEGDEPIEELSWTPTRVVWSRGGAIYRTFSYPQHHQQVVQATFANFHVPREQAASPLASTSGNTLDHYPTFGPFRPPTPPAWTEDPLPLPIHPSRARPQPPPKTERFLLVFLTDIAFAYPPGGGSIPFQLPFHLRRAWPMHRGILLERTREGHESDDPAMPPEMPTLYSLLGPADEMKVVASVSALSAFFPPNSPSTPEAPPPPTARPQLTGPTDPFQDLHERIISVSTCANASEPALVTVNSATGLVAVWAYATIPQALDTDSDPLLVRAGGEGSKSPPPSSRKKGKERADAPPPPTVVRPKRKRSSFANVTAGGDRSQRRASGGAGSLSLGIGLGGVSGGGNSNEADLLEALGETMGTAMKRTASAMSALTAADRRGSVTRNELSITMDRMALGGVLGGLGTGDLDREATFLREDVCEESRMVSDVFVHRVWELDLAQGGSRVFKNASAHVFDSRSSTSTLAILLPLSSTLLLLTLSLSPDGKLVVTPLHQISAIAATPVLATRPNVLDLLFLSPDNSWGILSANGRSEAVVGPTLPEDRTVKTLDGNGSTQFVVTLDNGSRHTAALPPLPTGLALRIMHVVSAVIPLDDFLGFQREIVKWKQKDPSASYLEAIEGVFAVSFATSAPSPPSSDVWANFIDATNSSSASDPIVAGLLSSTPPPQPALGPATAAPTSREPLEAIILGLHLLIEDLKLLADTHEDYLALSALVLPLVAALGLPSWVDYYERKCGGSLRPLPLVAPNAQPSHLVSSPPDLLTYFTLLLSSRTRPPPLLILSSIAPLFGLSPSNFYGPVDPCRTTRNLITIYSALAQPSPKAHLAVLCMDHLKWTMEDVSRIAVGVSMPLREALRACQLEAPEGWGERAYELIRRPDLARQIGGSKVRSTEVVKVVSQGGELPLSMETICEMATLGQTPKEAKVPLHTDAAPTPKATRFNEDRRLEEVGRMLQYTEPVTISAGDRTLDQLTPQVQQSILTALSNRTLALPIGFAMLNYRMTSRPIVEAVPIQRINTSARILPMPSPVALVDKESHTVPVGDRTEWPDFHSGVAAALSLRPGESGNLDSSQISFNKPADLDSRHAGFLMGLGLMGRYANALSFNQAFEYLKTKHDPTSIGVLLGLAVSYLGTADAKVTSLLSVHLTALHPPNSSPLNVSGITQAAGLVGIGLLYLGTGRRTIADIMVRELCAIKVTSIEDPAACREAYALSAGFAFGLIMLGAGADSTATANEVALLRTFRALILGESNHPLPGATPSLNVTDVNITSSAATIAVGLMYLRTERQDVADMLEIPDTGRRLDYVRSDLLLLRTLGRSLILWNRVTSSKAWVEAHIPHFIAEAVKVPVGSTKGVDGDMDIARWNIIAGACFGMGLKFAGTAAAEAHSTLIHYLDRLTRAAYVKASTVQQKIKRHAIRCCLSVVIISLSMVMAGTGEINVLRRLRVAHGHFSEGVTYGTHLASHMALGLLFVGSGYYTLGTSNSAIAALVLAFFPAFPPLPTENRAHLQAYRHLWTLAVEPRCLQVRDVDTNEPTFLPIKLRLIEQADAARTKQLVAKQLVAPTLIPEIRLIDSIQIDSPRYWAFTLHLAANPTHLASFLRDETIYVKRRTGHLSYAQDPRGIRSIFTRSKSEAGSAVFDFGEMARMLAPSATGLRDFVSAFSDDPEAIAAVAHLCHPEGSTAPPTAFEAYTASVLLECLTRDKRDTIGVYHALYHAHTLLSAAKPSPRALLGLEQLQFVEDFYQRGTFRAIFARTKPRAPQREQLVQSPVVEHVDRTLGLRAKALAEDPVVAEAVRAYLASSAWPVDPVVGRALSVWLSVVRAPSVEAIDRLRALALVALGGEGEEAGEEARSGLTLLIQGVGKATGEAGVRGWDERFSEACSGVWTGLGRRE